MSNTTDIMITCFCEPEIINKISEKAGIVLHNISNPKGNGLGKIVVFDCYVSCYESLGKDKIENLINEFKSAEWARPKFASLTIHDDSGDFSGGVIIIK